MSGRHLRLLESWQPAEMTLTNVWAVMGLGILAGSALISYLRPDNPKFWALVLIAGLGLPAAAIGFVYPRWKKSLRFSDREGLSDDEIYDRFFQHSGLPKAIVLKYWRQAARELNINRGKLHPGDRFDQELLPVSGWHFYDNGAEELLEHASRTLGRKESDTANIHVQTLGDYIQVMGMLDAGDGAPGRSVKR